jgi:hypothetical protein
LIKDNFAKVVEEFDRVGGFLPAIAAALPSIAAALPTVLGVLGGLSGLAGAIAEPIMTAKKNKREIALQERQTEAIENAMAAPATQAQSSSTAPAAQAQFSASGGTTPSGTGIAQLESTSKQRRKSKPVIPQTLGLSRSGVDRKSHLRYSTGFIPSPQCSDACCGAPQSGGAIY